MRSFAASFALMLMKRRNPMKKLLMMLAALLVLPMATGICFATDMTVVHDAPRTFFITAGNTNNPNCQVSLSRYVSFGYNVATNNQSYMIHTLHFAGDKRYATASDTTLIYWQTATTGTEAGTPAAADSTFTGTTGWNEM
jgi:hypothetical protein